MKPHTSGKTSIIKEIASGIATIMKALVRIIAYIPQVVQVVISIITEPYVTDTTAPTSKLTVGDILKSEQNILPQQNSETTIAEIKWFTIQDTVFGRISLFDVNFFDTSTGDADNPNIKIKEAVANWYYIIRDLSLMASLVILVYMGIKMAISTVAEDQAKYKSMLIAWTKSFVIIFILPYVLMFILNIASALVNLVPQKSTAEGFETKIQNIINNKLNEESVVTATGALITLILMAYYQVKFFVKYLFRFFKMAFLIIISPLITITYSLDKGSAHNKWLHEFISLAFVQFIHAVIYSVFIFSAVNIVEKVPILGIVFFMALSRGEKIFNYVFRLKNDEY